MKRGDMFAEDQGVNEMSTQDQINECECCEKKVDRLFEVSGTFVCADCAEALDDPDYEIYNEEEYYE